MDVETILSGRISDRVGRNWNLTRHAVKRAKQRRIPFSAIKATLSVGHDEKRPADNGAWEYNFAGVIVVVDSNERTVLTVYPEPGYGIDLDKVKITHGMRRKHKRDCRNILRDKKCWTSHTVAVIDQSGSMRAADIDKNVTRSDLVWLTLAVDLIKYGLESNERTATDVLSVVFMKNDATVLIDRQPIDWILFNRLVDIMNTEKPSTHGKYIPALEKAEDLLGFNRNRNCALALLFLSDGQPSDHLRRGVNVHSQQDWFHCMQEQMAERIEVLASLFGKRLNMCFYAIGPQESGDFSIMKHMAEQAKEYECTVVYQPATLKAGALSTALRTMSTTTTTTMTTISEIPKGFEYRRFVKMKQSDVGSPVVTETWEVIPQESYRDEFGDLRKRIVRSEWNKRTGWSTVYRVFSDPTAIGLGWETRWFGEGRERLAKELREVGPDGTTFVGPPLVLKASITVSNTIDVDSKDFHKRFCKSQTKAQQFAARFNHELAKLPLAVPSIEFLPCWVYMVEKESGERKGYLVEPALDVSQYQKFNDNQGNVYTGTSSRNGNGERRQPAHALWAIDEGDEDGEESGSEGEEDNTDFRATGSHRPVGAGFVDKVQPSDALQAFSCWTYKVASRQEYLVCDLQGTFVDDRDGTASGLYRLTDPVIHTSEVAQMKLRNKFHRHSDDEPGERFGRTDRGQDGITDFFLTHKCSTLCKMLGSRRLREALRDESSPHGSRSKTARYPGFRSDIQRMNGFDIRSRRQESFVGNINPFLKEASTNVL